MSKWLIIILVVAFFLRIYNLHYNTAFLDEALYITAGFTVLSGDIESSIGAVSWIGGSPFVYPLLSAIFYKIGGLVGARFFMVLLGTCCVYLMYLFTKELRFFKEELINERAGLVATSFMAITTAAIATSRIALYDGLSFTLFLLGLIIFQRAVRSENRKYYLISSGIFFLSFLAKYVALSFFPFILLVPVLLAARKKNIQKVKDIAIYFAVPLFVLIGGYIITNFANLTEFIVEQEVVSKASFSDVSSYFWEYTGITYVLCLLGLPFLWKKNKILLIVLFLFSIIPLLTHTITGNDDSVQQHTFLSILFTLPILGAIFASLIQRWKKVGLVLAALALGTQVIFTIPQVQSAESFWPDLRDSVKVLKTTIKPSDRILAESGDSMYLEIQDKIAHEQLEGPFVFSYGDKEGIEAYTNALNNGYFQYVQLDGVFFSEEDIQAIEKVLNVHYKKIFDDGSVRIYKLNN